MMPRFVHTNEVTHQRSLAVAGKGIKCKTPLHTCRIQIQSLNRNLEGKARSKIESLKSEMSTRLSLSVVGVGQTKNGGPGTTTATAHIAGGNSSCDNHRTRAAHWNAPAIRAAILTDSADTVARELMRHPPSIVADNVRKRQFEEARRARQQRLRRGVMTVDDFGADPSLHHSVLAAITDDQRNSSSGHGQLLPPASGEGGYVAEASTAPHPSAPVRDEDAFGPLTNSAALHSAIMVCYLTDPPRQGVDGEEGEGGDEGCGNDDVEFDAFGGRRLAPPSALGRARAEAAERRATLQTKETSRLLPPARNPSVSAYGNPAGVSTSSNAMAAKAAAAAPSILPQGIPHVAAANGKFAVLEWALQHAPEAVFWAADSCQWAPLHYAAFNGHEGVCALLLRSNADRDLEDAYGDTAGEVVGQQQEAASEGVVALLGEYAGGAGAFSSDSDESEGGSGGRSRKDGDDQQGAGGYDDDAAAERARRIRQRRRRRAAKAKLNATLEERLAAQAKVLEERLAAQKALEAQQAEEAEGRRQARRALVARRREARQHYEVVRIRMMIDCEDPEVIATGRRGTYGAP